MHEKSVVDGASARGLRGSDRPFVRLWNRVGKQRRSGAYTAPLWSPLVVRPLVLYCLILCWLLSLWSSLVFASLVFVFCGLLLSCPLLSCLLLSWSQRALSGGFLEASSAPLGGPFGPPGALRGPLGTDCGPLDGPWSLLGAPGPSWCFPGARLTRNLRMFL